MLKLEFIIDRETCFAHWVQGLIKWSWRFYEKNATHYKAQGGQFTTEELSALGNLQQRLAQERTGSSWLWERYANIVPKSVNEQELWGNVRKILAGRFDAVWEREFPLLEKWRDALSEYPFERLEDVLERVKYFFGTRMRMPSDISVKLCLYSSYDEMAVACVHREYPTLILLGISQVPMNSIKSVIGAIAHEIIHLIEYQSPISERILKDAYNRVLMPLKIERKGPKWRDLFTESIIYSIAGRRVEENYVGRTIILQPSSLSSPSIPEFNLSTHVERYALQKRIAGIRLLPVTTEYLNTNKKMDGLYGTKVAETWRDLLIRT